MVQWFSIVKDGTTPMYNIKGIANDSCFCAWSGGYNLQDVVFYWTRGNESVKGLDTLRLAQYSVESYYTSVSEAVYETGAPYISWTVFTVVCFMQTFNIHNHVKPLLLIITVCIGRLCVICALGLICCICTCAGNYPKLVLHFSLRRNVLFFILETYVPSTLLVVLSWVSFWISQSSVPARTCIG